MNQKKSTVFLLGTPYCGSTILGCVLNALDGVSYIGEVDRLPFFEQYKDAPGHYKTKCAICETHREYDCNFWTEDFIDTISRENSLLERYLKIIYTHPMSIVVDGSKSPRWFHTLLCQGIQKYVKVYAIVCVKNVISFCESIYKAEVNPQVPWRAAEIWRDVYIHAIRCCSTYTVPTVVVRNEDFRSNLSTCIEKILVFLGLDISCASRIDKFHLEDLHCIGGNLGSYVHQKGFDIGEAIRKFPEWRARIKDKMMKPLILQREHAKDSKRALGSQDYASICNVPCLGDILGHLGYSQFYDIREVVLAGC